ncbi:MAG: glycoside hydrolase family 25 protein [Anaerolineae bacterium]|nr:glycoside hydrolase family 25 protein [Anaerolineae bacterium]
MIPGFDVSKYQRGLDMAAAADTGMQFVIVRASTGIEVDPVCAEHLRGAEGRMLRGTYHSLQPGDPVAQATTYYRALIESNGFLTELPPVVGVEKPGTTEDMVHGFLDSFSWLWGRPPLVYTSRSKWHSLVGVGAAWASQYGLWVAHWNVGQPDLPIPWADWILWQHTIGWVPFWPRRIDLDWCTEETWASFVR